MNDLEKEFRETVVEISNQIRAKVREASKALDEAVALSEEHGVPFYSTVSPLSQTYSPTSVVDKWPGLDSETIEDISGGWTREYGFGAGWQHSAVCY